MLSGYKSYLAAAALFLFGLYGLFTGNLDQNAALQAMMQGAAVFGLRNAIK